MTNFAKPTLSKQSSITSVDCWDVLSARVGKSLGNISSSITIDLTSSVELEDAMTM